MKFGYFTLSDNRYKINTRTPEELVKNIYDQALYAEEIGLNSAWIGEHHFNLFGVNSSPHTVLSQLAGATSRIRLAPAVTLTPLQHPLFVAEQWATLDLLSGGRVDFAAGRGYDRKEYMPFEVSFDDSAEIFEETLDIIWRAWTEADRWSHKGKYYNFEDVMVRPRPLQDPLIPYVACFSRVSMNIAVKNGWNIIFAPFAAKLIFESLKNAVDEHREGLAANRHAPKAAKCSYFLHIADTKEEEDYGRERLITYFREAALPAFPQTLEQAPPTLRYFVEIVERMKKLEPDALTSDSILVGSTQTIIDKLKEIEAAGIDEVILYFTYGLKPHTMVKEQMQRFVEDIAVAFEDSSRGAQAAE